MYLKLAWRNIWRNKKRTIITCSSIMFAVFFSCSMRSLQYGSYDRMIDNAVRFYAGYIQIHTKGYWDDEFIDYAFLQTPQLEKSLKAIDHLDVAVPRIESFVLTAVGDMSRGALLVGIDPEKEDKLSELKSKLVEGEYLEPNDKSVLVAEGLLNYLDLKLGDTLVMIGQGYHGINSAGKYVIKGVVKFGSFKQNNRLLYLPLKEAQWFYGAEGRITSYALVLPKDKYVDEVVADISKIVDLNQYEVMGWKEMIPELVQQREMDVVGGYIIITILYIIIAFGIFGTVIMMVQERMYEFGVLISIGMSRSVLNVIVALESLMLTMMGVFAGLILSYPVAYYLNVNPIVFADEKIIAAFEKIGEEPVMPFSIDPAIFWSQIIIVFGLSLVISIYPAFKINLLKPVEAMRK
ncbi:MAG: ABC transporter permease [Flavobacteriales bacterium]|nr:ABC transporter permease [Flavobacteriales bacterium]